VNASDGYHLWSARFDRRIDDVFTVQDEITRAIVENLKGRLLTPKDMPVVRRATSDMAAYQLYLKGRYHFARRYQGGLERAVECFSNAIERDPGSASALAGLADALSLEGFYGLGPPRRLLARARGAAERAIALEGSLPEAHHALGMVHLWMDWNWEAVDRAFRRALQLDPNAPLSRAYYALSLAIMGFGERAEREAEEATGLDPLSALTWNVAASTCFMLRRYGAAIESGRRAYDLDPGFLPASWVLGLAFSAAGRHEEAIEAADRGGRMTGRAPFFLGILGHALGRAGRRSAAARVLEELRERSRTGYVSPIQFAVVHDGLGEVEEGLAVLERGMADWGGAYVLPLASPAYDTLRGHPRFAEMLRSAGYVGPWASSDGARRAGHREENPSGGRIAGGNGD
jgi:serine/threonine-protein kinase